MSSPDPVPWWSFYSNTDGTFSGKQFSSSNPDAVAMNTPSGYTALEGQYDSETQIFNLTTKQVTDKTGT